MQTIKMYDTNGYKVKQTNPKNLSEKDQIEGFSMVVNHLYGQFVIWALADFIAKRLELSAEDYGALINIIWKFTDLHDPTSNYK